MQNSFVKVIFFFSVAILKKDPFCDLFKNQDLSDLFTKQVGICS